MAGKPRVNRISECSKCGRERAVGKRCKPCAVVNATEWKQAHPEQARKGARAYRERNIETVRRRAREWANKNYALNRDTLRAKGRAWSASPKGQAYEKKRYAEHKNDHAAKHKAWREANPERMYELQRAWRENNREKSRLYCVNRYARKKGAFGTLTPEQWDDIKAAQNDCCYDCGKKCAGKLTVGHLVPITKGGTNLAENIIAQCQSCNSKQNVRIHSLAYERGLLT